MHKIQISLWSLVCLLLLSVPGQAQAARKAKKMPVIKLENTKPDDLNAAASKPKELPPKEVKSSRYTLLKNLGKNKELNFGVAPNASLSPSEAANPTHNSLHKETY